MTTKQQQISAFWVTFNGRGPGCVEATDPEAAKMKGLALTGCEPTDANILPYPTEPRLNKHVFTDSTGKAYSCPSLCFAPRQCVGKTACPQRYSCSE